METILKTVCAFGDSVMKGIVVDKENSPVDGVKYKISSDGFAARCCRRLGLEIENYARFGGVVSHGMKLVNRYAEKIRRCDCVLFEYGGNDCDYNWAEIAENPSEEHCSKTPIGVFVKHYSDLIDFVKSLGTKPVLLSLPVLEPNRFFAHVSKGLNRDNILRWLGGSVLSIDRWHERYNMEIFRLGAEKRVPVIDITSVFLERKDFAQFICEDGIHPNEAGHELIESAVVDFLSRNKILI